VETIKGPILFSDLLLSLTETKEIENFLKRYMNYESLFPV